MTFDDEIRNAVLGVMHILRLNGIEHVSVGGLLRILGTASQDAELYDNQFIVLVSDNEIAAYTADGSKTLH